MIRTHVTGFRQWLLSGALLIAAGSTALAQEDGFSSTRVRRPIPPDLSQSTAILEEAVRSLYVTIEPGSNTDNSPNELLAYADLRSLRLYAGALEVAGWSLERTAADYDRYDRTGAYRNGRGRVTDPQALAALERYRAYRETVRSLLQRVRSTAVLAEHQISFCDPQVNRQWKQDVIPALRDTINATDPIFEEDIAYQRYGIPGQTAKVINTAGNGITGEAVEIARNPTYQPYDGQGRGQGRYFQVRSFGGALRVKTIRYRNHENAFGLQGTSSIREIAVDQVVEPGDPLFIPCNRKRWVDVSELEIEWESAERGRKVYGVIELVEESPDDQN